jgi:hypothetical protein
MKLSIAFRTVYAFSIEHRHFQYSALQHLLIITVFKLQSRNSLSQLKGRKELIFPVNCATVTQIIPNVYTVVWGR